MPNDKYIHPEYTKVEDTITRGGRTEKAYRIVRRPPSVALTPESGTAQYDPAGGGTTVTAKMVDADQTTELKPATFKWYQGDALLGEGQTMTLSEPGTYRVVGRFKNKDYEATYEVKPADISSGYTLGFSKSATFTGFAFGKDFVTGGVQLFKEGSDTPIEGFTYEVVSCGENINAGTGAGTYTVTGKGNFTGELSGSFDIAMADFGAVAFAVRPTNPTYTGVPVQPAVTGTLTTDGRTYTLDPSEYMVTYENNKNVGTGAATVTSREKNFSPNSTQREFTIEKATNDVSVSMEGWASGEAAKSPSATANFDANKATFAYKAKGAGDDAYSGEVPSKPGDYTVRATIAASDNYEAGVATADFTIAPMPLTIEAATAAGRAYETGNTAVDISGVTFKNSKGEPVALTKGTDYTVSGEMETADAGDGKSVTVTVTLANSDYSLAQNTATTTVNIAKAPAPAAQSIRVEGPITYIVAVSATEVSQSVAGMAPEGAGTPLTYNTGAPVKPEGVTVDGFAVSEDGVVSATLLAVEEGQEVTLPVTITSPNYEDATVNVVVKPTKKTHRNVTLSEYSESMTYGDGTFTLTATATDSQTGAAIETQPGDWWWYSTDPNVLEVDERGSSTMTVTVKGAGSAMILAWYEPYDSSRQEIGGALTESITVNKRPLTVTVANQESIYVGGTLPDLPDGDAVSLDGLATGDSRSAVTLDYSPQPVNTKPGTYAIVASNVHIKNATSADVTANYNITYVDGTFEVKPKETQTITADDVTVTYGDTDKSVSASVTYPAEDVGTLSYAVTSGSDCVSVDEEGALTIKKSGPATVTVTAAETATCAQTTKDVTVTVLKAESKAANVSDPDFGWTYDGTERRLVVVKGEVTGGTMRYSLDGKNFSNSVPTATDAGDYTVWYKVAGDENHNDTEVQSIEVTVYKAEPVVSIPGPLSATCDDLLEDVKLPEVEGGTWSWGADPGAIVEHAGENHFEAIFTPDDTTNYDTTNTIATVIAAKGESSVSKAPEGKTLSYNAEMQALVTAGTAKGGTMVYSLDGEDFVEDPSAAAEVGDYTVWYMVAGDEDHNDSEARQVASKIGKGDISQATVELAETSYVYDGVAKEPAAKVTLGGRELEAGTDYDVSYKDNVNVGTATATVTGKGNYAGTATATFSIEAEPAPTPGPEPTPTPTPVDPDLKQYEGTAAKSVSDLKAGEWYMEPATGAFPGTNTLYLDYTIARGLMSGYTGDRAGQFGPHDLLGRAQTATILYRLANPDSKATTDPAAYEDNKSGLPDVASKQYYTAAVNWCVREGVITGYKNEAGKYYAFGPDDSVSREQLATMIFRYCTRYAKRDADTADIMSFSDYARISDWARDGVAYCVANNIVGGYTDGSHRFGPQDSAERCQMSKIIAVTAYMLDVASSHSSTEQPLVAGTMSL